MQKSRNELQVIQDAIQEKLTQRAILREDKVRDLPSEILFHCLRYPDTSRSPPQTVGICDSSGIAAVDHFS